MPAPVYNEVEPSESGHRLDDTLPCRRFIAGRESHRALRGLSLCGTGGVTRRGVSPPQPCQRESALAPFAGGAVETLFAANG